MKDQNKQKPIYSIVSVLAPVSGIALYVLIATLVGATDTTHGFFNVFLVVELLWYSAIGGFIAGLIGTKKKESPVLLSIIGLIVNGALAIFLGIAILKS